jgi:GNAT superfamily N-acetyltransferase
MNEKISALRTKYFPLKLNDGYEIVVADKKTVREFLNKHFEAVFPKSSNALPTLLINKERESAIEALVKDSGYDSLHQEHFLFTFKGEPVGWSTGETADFMTYYMRNSGIIPEHQNKKLYSQFLAHFADYIKEIGYERLTSQHKADNSEILITKLKAGFVISGMDFDERWGALVRVTKFLHADRESAFKDCFGR